MRLIDWLLTTEDGFFFGLGVAVGLLAWSIKAALH